MPPTPNNFIINPDQVNIQAPKVQEQIAGATFVKEGEVSMAAPREMIGGIDYKERLTRALKHIEEHSDDFLTPEALQTYSPKFLTMIENIEDSEDFELENLPVGKVLHHVSVSSKYSIDDLLKFAANDLGRLKAAIETHLGSLKYASAALREVS